MFDAIFPKQQARLSLNTIHPGKRIVSAHYRIGGDPHASVHAYDCSVVLAIRPADQFQSTCETNYCWHMGRVPRWQQRRHSGVWGPRI